ncbi:hypothetical protein [Flammeovirga pacifica]|uniref:Helix-hairpin-helix domain-containing protein n=1 Tax=Flammeovirga pacifica TaxID=915059 RepID=A0A1S1Z0J7_FLAPC|nr:hypothetical protein [Flammeovirga pacifica]OHX66794.1 hypothetical protein NH26_10715 [Flammeovirga pacifica]
MRSKLLFFFFLVYGGIIAQSNEEQSLLEDVFSAQQLELMSDAETDYWLNLFQHPREINRMKPLSILTTFGLTYDELEVFLSYKKEFGKLVNKREIDRLEWEEQTKRRVKQGVFIDKNDEEFLTLKDRWVRPDQHYLMLNSTMKLPVDINLNQPFSTQIRGKWAKKNDYSVGVNISHTSEDEWLWNPSQSKLGSGFSSFHVALYNRQRVKKVVIGDYQMIGGQGLVFGGGYFLGKGGDPLLSVYRGQDGIRPYSSLSSTNFLRGGAIELSLGDKISTEVFVSHQNKSLNVLDFEKEEIEKKEIGETVIGQRIGFVSQNLKVHWNGLVGLYDQRVVAGKRTDSLGVFKGNSLVNTSIDVSYQYENLHLVTELATSFQNNFASNTTLFIHLMKGVNWVVLYRKYSSNFISPYGNSLGELSRLGNEEGLYMGVKLEQYKKWGLNFYVDVFKFPTATYQQEAGREGVECKLNGWVKVKSGQKVQFEASYDEVGKYVSTTNSKVKIYDKEQLIKGSLRYLLTVNKHLNWTLRGLVSQFSSYNENDFGYMFYQDLNWDWKKKFYVSGRVAYFNSPDYSTRLYAYEKNIRYAYSFPPYYGIGWKYYLLMKCRLGKGHYLSGRWSTTKLIEDLDFYLNENRPAVSHQMSIQMVLKI